MAFSTPAVDPRAAVDLTTGEVVCGNKDALLMAWKRAAEELAIAADTEKQARADVLRCYLPANAAPGTYPFALGNGWVLKIVKPAPLSIRSDVDNNAVSAALTAVAAVRLPDGSAPAELNRLRDVVEWKPKLDKRVYDEFAKTADEALAAQFRAAFAPILVQKPGAATVDIVPPKETTA